MPWTIELYESQEEGCPAQDFLLSLDKAKRAKVLALIKLLEEQGPTLPFPYSIPVRGKIRELRTHYSKEHYRVLYFGAPGRTFVLLHAFAKRTQTTPEADIRQAEKRMKTYLEKGGL